MAKKARQPIRDLTTAELAKELGIVRRSALGLIERGHFPNARKLPGKTSTHLIPYSDLRAYLRRRARKQKSAASPQSEG